MNIGIVGLGLIGGSMAKAFKESGCHKVYGMDKNIQTIYKARLTDSIDDQLTIANLKKCDIIIIALYPKTTIDFLSENAGKIKKDALVIDCCGIKRAVCDACKKVAADYGFVFIGGHPMAGTENWGFDSSRATLFKGASMILVPDENIKIEVLEKAKILFKSIGFTKVVMTSADEHDRIIAFTSQLAHIVSGAYIKNKSALKHKGFSAGSYKDMTRVAKLNEEMWTSLFMLNADYLSAELGELIAGLEKYKSAIDNRDEESLKSLLKEGREMKKTADAR